MTAPLYWDSFVTEDDKVLCNTVASSWLFITLITKELLLQESKRIISLVEIWIMQGHSRMTSFECPSYPHDDRRKGTGFNQTAFEQISIGFIQESFVSSLIEIDPAVLEEKILKF